MFIFTEICCHRLLLLEGLLMLTVLYTSRSISRASRENVASSTRSSCRHGWLQLCGRGAGFVSLTVTVDGVPRSPPPTGFSVGLLHPHPLGQWHRVQGKCCLLRLCCSSPVDACSVVACFPSQTSVGRTCCVSPEL